MAEETNPFDKTVDAEARQVKEDGGVTNEELMEAIDTMSVLLVSLQAQIEAGVPGRTV